MNIKYYKLEIQKYFLCGDRTIEISKPICKARGPYFDIKTQNNGNTVRDSALAAKLWTDLEMKYYFAKVLV